MDSKFIHLIENLSKQSVSNDAVVAYMVMRCEVTAGNTSTSKAWKVRGGLVSGLDLQTLANRTRVNLLTAQRLVDELVRAEWIRPKRDSGDLVYQLGEIKDFTAEWFADSTAEIVVVEKVEKPSDRIRAMLAEKRARDSARHEPVRLSTDAKRKMLADAGIVETTKNSSTLFVEIYNKKFREVFHAEPKGVKGDVESRPSPQTYVYVGRMLKIHNRKLEIAVEFMDWVFSNWEKLATAAKVSGNPTLNILCTKSFIDTFRGWRISGIPERRVPVSDKDGIGKRADSAAIEEAADLGWS